MICSLGRRKEIIIPDRPHLLGEDEHLFLESLERAERYLEYGAGGSTVVAARHGVRTVCVESDRRFAKAMERKIRPFNHHVVIHWADIGTTGKWGRPMKILATPRRRRRWPDYVYAPDRYRGDEFFDLVLIDGRFRVSCALFVFRRAVQTSTPCLVCFDDYTTRPEYHVVERYCKPERLGVRMAFFRPLTTGLVRMPKDDEVRKYSKQPE